MTSYTDALSDGLIPPSDQGFVSATVNGSVITYWPFEYTNTGLPAARIMELYISGSSQLTLPAANKVSLGESILIRNTGVAALTLLNKAGNSIGSVSAGLAMFVYVKSNTSEAGEWGMFVYGAGVSYVSAGQLQGNGTKAEGNTLSVASPIIAYTASTTLLDTHRGHLVEFTGGATDLTLQETYVYGTDFYVYIKNAGTGQLLMTPQAGEYIDGQTSLGLQPNEACILLCDGSGNFLTVGHGRSTLYQFSQLSLDVSAGGTFTLSSSQASNKMLTFVGNPAADVTVEVPALVSVYYAANNLSVNQGVTVKTHDGAGSLMAQSERAVLLCDGTNVTSAQTAALTGIQSIINGTQAAPALNFVSTPNTGFYKYSTQGIGISVAGAVQLRSNGGGVEIPVDLLLGATSKLKLGSSFGTAGQLLFSAGAGAPPYWDDPSQVTSVAYAEQAGYATQAGSAASATDATKVLKTGDTMTGNLAISNSSPYIALTDTTSGGMMLVNYDADIVGFYKSGAGWKMYVTDGGNIWTPAFGFLTDYFAKNDRYFAWELVYNANPGYNVYLNFYSLYGPGLYRIASNGFTYVLIATGGSSADIINTTESYEGWHGAVDRIRNLGASTISVYKLRKSTS